MSSQSPKARLRQYWWHTALFLVAIAVVVVLSALIYQYEIGALRAEHAANLQVIVAVKAHQLDTFRRERLNDTFLMANRPFFNEAYATWLDDPTPDIGTKLQQSLAAINPSGFYTNIVLFDTSGQERLRLYPDRPFARCATVDDLLVHAMDTGSVQLGDVHSCTPGGPPQLEVAAPLLVEQNGAQVPVGTILLAVDIPTLLFPLVNEWPVASTSGETLVGERRGDVVVNLNDYRNGPPALSLRRPITETDLPLVQAVIQGEGTTLGRDYRGVDVLAAFAPVPDSPWRVVAKMDLAEVDAPQTNQLGWYILATLGAIILGGALVSSLILFQRQATLRQLYQAEQALNASEARYRTLFDAAGDPITVTDSAGQIVDVNDSACTLLGRPRTELLGAPSKDLIADLPDEVQPAPNDRVVQEGSVSLELQIRRKDGTLVPVEVNVTVLPDNHQLAIMRDVSERKRAEAALRDSEARLKAVIENTRDLIWSVDRNLSLLVFNSAFASNMQILLGRPLALGESALDDRLPPEVRAFWQPLYDRALAGESVAVELEPLLARGGTHECYLNPTRDDRGTVTGVATRIVDITARIQAEMQVREALQRLQLATRAAGIGIWDWNFADDSLVWDERMCELYAVPVAVLESRIDYDLWRARLHPDDLEWAEATLAEARRTGDDWDITFRIVLSDGAIRYIHTSSVIEYDRKGEPLRMIGINRDVTEQQTFERRLRDANAELERRVTARTTELAAALDEVKRSSQLKDEFMAAVSHELRTPLTGVLGMAEALEGQYAGPLNERQLRYVTTIQESGNRLLSLVNSILHYTALLGGKVILQKEPCVLAELGATALRSIRPQTEKKGQAVEYSVEPRDLTIVSDRNGIIQVLHNLLDNAVKFTPDGGRIGLTVRHDILEGCVRLVVWDTGAGISAEQQAIIFQPFVQGDASLARRHEGVGLGLAYVQRMVELLGGTIAVESEPDQGSRFIVKLPLA